MATGWPRHTEGDIMANKMTYSVKMTGIFCQETVHSTCDWKMFPKEAKEEVRNFCTCREIETKSVLVTNGEHVVLAYGKNF